MTDKKLLPTNTLRIFREYDYIGHEEKRIEVDTLQQLWVESAAVNYSSAKDSFPPNSEWRDVSIVEFKSNN